MKIPSLSGLWGGQSIKPAETTGTTGSSPATAPGLGSWILDAVGFGGAIDSAHLKPGSHLSFPMALTASDAHRLENGDGVVSGGHGVLTGELALREVQSTSPMFAATTQKQAVLITANLGMRHEVSFALDLPSSEAQKLLDAQNKGAGGHVRVQIEGDFNSGDTNRGSAKKCRLVGSATPLYLAVGDTIEARGRVSHCYQTGNEFGIPLGHYLDLEKPIFVNGTEFTEVYLPGAEALSLQQQINIKEELKFGRFSDVGKEVAYVDLSHLEPFHRLGDAPRTLDKETLENISDIGGWRVEGYGKLQGRIEIGSRDGKETALLVTSSWGGAQKDFALDVPVDQLRQQVGHGAKVKGLVIHDGRNNRIAEAKVEAVPDPRVHQLGEAVSLRGMVRQEWTEDSSGESRPSFTLTLAEPILLGERRVQQLRLDCAFTIESGTKLSVEGKLKMHEYQSNTGERLEGVSLTELKNLRQAADMDAFAILHDEISDDFPYQMRPRLRIQVPNDQ